MMNTTGVIFGWFMIPLCCVAAAAQPQHAPQLTNVFVSGADGYHTYRIPALLVTPKGDLLAFCEGRKNSRSDTGDIDLLVKRSVDGGRTWPIRRVLWPGPAAYSCLAVLPDGAAACLFEAGDQHAYERIVLARISLDGRTGP